VVPCWDGSTHSFWVMRRAVRVWRGTMRVC